eukprot:TRINITY_DN6283_c0_g3_i1.p1 TRINITY_DN6283_c0_g3~~TRINITY_DN6283_c0_g3_i1.p1  ORF type:complete len:352 (-),score=32.31 TRINITY_DN6283_c0_g3_i1:52-987(-)
MFATQCIEANRLDTIALPDGPRLERVRDCSLGGYTPDLRSTYQCVHIKGESITRVVDGAQVSLKKFCRVASEGFNEQRFARRLDALTSLVKSVAKASGLSANYDELRQQLQRAKVNVWIEKLGGEIISHSAFYAKTEPNETCAVGTAGTLAVAPAWQGKRLATESDIITDIAYDLGYTAFHTTTKVTNLESLRTQRRTSAGFRLKGMGRIFGYLEAQQDLSETQPKGTVFVALMSPTGGWYSCVHHMLKKNFVKECGPVLMKNYVSTGKYKQVNFTKADVLQQVKLDPETPERALRVLTSSISGVLDLKHV